MRVPDSSSFPSDNMGKKRHKLNKKDLERSRCDSSDESVNNAAGKKPAGAGSVEKEDRSPKDINLHLPSVKGLTNLGNTCFFNAVLQVLCQTEELENILSTQCKKGAVLHLPARNKEEAEEKFSDDDDGDGDSDSELCSKLLPITLTLPEGGALAQALATVLTDMKTTRNGSISPGTLFRQVCKKVPQFKGAQQQDSHELLRHLLDGMKVEEIRRSQASILKHFNLPQNVNPKNVPDDVKDELKASGRLAKNNTFVDKLFGGYLISTVVCEECNIASHVFEPFLDLSLPISEEKPSRSVPVHKKEVESSVKDNVNEKYAAPVSKHKQKMAKKNAKREAKLARRQARKKSVTLSDDKGADNNSDDAVDKNGEEDDQSLSDDGEQEQTRFADVEDNTESDTSRRISDTGVVKPSTLGAVDEIDDNPQQTVDNTDEKQSDIPEKPALNGTVDESKTVDSGINPGSSSNVDSCNVVSEKLAELDLNDSKNNSNDSVICNGDLLMDSSNDSTENPKNVLNSNQVIDSDDTTNSIRAADNDHMPNKDEGTKLSSDSSDGCSDGEKVEINHKKPNSRQEVIKMSMSTLAPRSQPSGSDCSVESCLRQFTSPELLTGNNKFGCELCTKEKYPDKNQKGYQTVYTNASKQLLLYSLPPVLTLHLKRFQQVGYSLRKVNRHVNFPLVMDIAAYCSSMAQGVQDTKVLYGLYGIVEHSGRLSGGHYTAYVRVRPKSEASKQYLQRTLRMKLTMPRKSDLKNTSQTDDCKIKNIVLTGRWFHISDTCVREVSEATVLKCQAYLLFYERLF